MEDRLKEIAGRCAEVEDQLARPEVLRDTNRFRDLTREHAQIKPIVVKYEEYRKVRKELAESEEVLKGEKDEEMREMVRAEMAVLRQRLEALDAELMMLLLPRDPGSGKNVIMEIRAGTGGEEAALFVADLFRMYSRYIDDQGWRLEFIDGNPTGIGGYKEVIFSVSGAEAYDNLRYESGVHRVQRIPSTESGGRIHTSAVTVAVLPEAEESDIVIDPNDLRIDVYRSTGHGGQSVNTTDSAVRITHIPTGMVVTCQDEKSQLKNKTKALKVLRARLFERMEQERLEKEAREKRSQVGSGDRSERIRTYNFPQSRVTDHRIGLTVHALESFLEGDLNAMIDALKRHDVEQKLKTAVG
ncbi:MAG: peptide chain release factor 1 [Spirochaetes bacterium]|jgi:peptide chain release factor 1|nr:peptide chain release factor 1 [Spirochaetota bacterium]